MSYLMQAHQRSILYFSRSLSQYLENMKIIGVVPSAMNASNELPVEYQPYSLDGLPVTEFSRRALTPAQAKNPVQIGGCEG